MSLQRSRTTRPRSALSSNSARSRETCRPARWVWIYGKRWIQNRQNCLWKEVALEPQKNLQPWKKLGASRTQPRGGVRSRPEMAPQRFEKIESAPGNGMASEASDPQHLVRRLTVRGPGSRASRMTRSRFWEVAEKGAQCFEIARCKTEIGACPRHLLRARRRGAAQRAGRGGMAMTKKIEAEIFRLATS
jgi:hypothetical protein